MTYTYLYVYNYVYIYMNMYVCMQVHMYVCMYVCLYTGIFLYNLLFIFQGFSSNLYPFWRDENGDPRTPRDSNGFPPFDG